MSLTENLMIMVMGLYGASVLAVVPLRRSYGRALRIGHAITFLASLSLLAFTVEAWLRGPLSFSWFGVPFHVDGLSLILCLVLSILGMATSLYSPSYMEVYERLGRGWLYVVLYSTFMASMVLVVTVSNMLWFLFFWEAMTLSSYLLIVWEADEESVRRAGWRYFVTMHLASTLPLLLAAGIMYSEAGSLDFSVLASSHLGLSPLLYLLFLIGFGSKAGVFPLHFWLPDAHPAAPSNVSALLSGVMIKVAVYGLIRSTCFILKPSEPFGFAVALVGTVTLTIGTLYALRQTDAKRLLAYHSVGQMGYIWLGVGVGIFFIAKGGSWAAFGVMAMAAGLFHLVNHALFKGLLFLSAGSVLYRTGTRDLNRLGGLGRLMPVTALFTFVAAMSIAGVPPLNGFMSKWLIYQSTFLSRSGWFVLFGVFALFISAATLASFIKFYTAQFEGSRGEAVGDIREVPAGMLAGKGLLTSLCVLFGVLPGLVLPLLTDPGSAVTGVSVRIGSVWSANVIPTTGAGASHFNPLLFVLVLVVLTAAALAALPLKKSSRRGRIWTTGEPVPSADYGLRAMHYYGPFEHHIDWLYRTGSRVADGCGRTVAAASAAYIRLCRALSDACSSVGRAVSRAGAGYERHAGEEFLDEAIVSPIVDIIKGSASVLEDVLSNQRLMTVIALAFLTAVVVILLAGGV
ncbi:MAG: hydantoin racemase [Thermococci archaeon]|nr:hydantoin racemase [Thermococci archaeon]